jgi:hypothetical protein
MEGQKDCLCPPIICTLKENCTNFSIGIVIMVPNLKVRYKSFVIALEFKSFEDALTTPKPRD